MSISQNIKTNRLVRKFKNIGEYICRKYCFDNPYKVYFPYKADFIHPAFSELTSSMPIKYSNKKEAKLLHLVMGGTKKDLDQKHILEIIDHAFSIIAFFDVFPREPIEYFNRQKKIKELYLSNNLLKIIFISKGQRELFRNYFPQKVILDKSVVIPLPWKDNIEIGKKVISKTINFLFIASNYQSKGVEIVLNAWKKFKSKDNKNCKLTLVSHDIPKYVEENLQDDIKLIKKAPLLTNLKNRLYKNSDVVLALTLTDGVTAIEATSYGKPIITFRTQHSNDFIDNDNGIQIDVPINIYDVDKYGIVWKTKREFNEIVNEYIKNGFFNIATDELVNTFDKYSSDEIFLEQQTRNAIEKYYKDYTVENRNQKLLKIYD